MFMKIRMLRTTSGSYDGVNTKEYVIGSEYAVGRDLISVDLAKVFIDSAAAVEIQEPADIAEGEAIPGDNLSAPKNAEGSEPVPPDEANPSEYPAADPYGTEKTTGPTGPSETKKRS
jgi:hypothetical protein